MSDAERDGNVPRTRISLTLNGQIHRGHYQVDAHHLTVTYRGRSGYENLGRLGWYPGVIARDLFRRLVADSLREQE